MLKHRLRRLRRYPRADEYSLSTPIYAQPTKFPLRVGFRYVHKAISAVAFSLNTENNAICAMSLIRGFCRKSLLSRLKNTLNGCHGNQSVPCDQALDKLSEKNLTVGCQYKRTMVFWGGHNLPIDPWQQELQKSQAFIRLNES